MLKEAIEDALKRGHRLKREVVGQVLSSVVLNELLSSDRFAKAVTRIIETKEEVVKTVRRNVQDVLKIMNIPSRDQIASYERRVQKLEDQISTLDRRVPHQTARPKTRRKKKS